MYPSEMTEPRLKIIPASEAKDRWMVTLDEHLFLRIFDDREDAELYCKVLEATELLSNKRVQPDEVYLDRVA